MVVMVTPRCRCSLLAVLCMVSATSFAAVQPPIVRGPAVRTDGQTALLSPGVSARSGDLVLPNVTHSGYLPIDPEDGSSMFYAYHEAQRGVGPGVPIILWLEMRCLPVTHLTMHSFWNCAASMLRSSTCTLCLSKYAAPCSIM